MASEPAQGRALFEAAGVPVLRRGIPRPAALVQTNINIEQQVCISCSF